MNSRDIETTKIALFKGKRIRKTIHNNKWWFSIIDVIAVLTGNARPRKYWSDLKKKLIKESYSEVSEKIGQLKLEAPDGKLRETDCADTETLFRIVQSIPSPKAEPFKRWLAKTGGSVAGKARTETEKEIGRSVVSKENYLQMPESRKQLKAKK